MATAVDANRNASHVGPRATGYTPRVRHAHPSGLQARWLAACLLGTVALLVPARGHACAARTSGGDVRAAIDGLVENDAGNPASQARLEGAVACLGEPLTLDDVALLHLAKAAAAAVAGDARLRDATLDAVVAVRPEVSVPDAWPHGSELVGGIRKARARRIGTDAQPLPTSGRGWHEVDGRHATMYPTARPYLLQTFDEAGAVVSTQYIRPASERPPTSAIAKLSEGPAVGEHTASSRQEGTQSRSGSTAATAPRAPAAPGHTTRRVALGVATGGALVTAGALVLLADDAHDRALDPAAADSLAYGWAQAANTYSYGWVATTIVASGLGLALVITW